MSTYTNGLTVTSLRSVYVTERRPECHINASSVVNVGDLIEIRCNVNFSGSFTPEFHCFRFSATIPPSE